MQEEEVALELVDRVTRKLKVEFHLSTDEAMAVAVIVVEEVLAGLMETSNE